MVRPYRSLFRNQELNSTGTAPLHPASARSRATNAKAIRNEAAELGPSVMLVSNIRKNGKPIGSLLDGEMMFHSDTPYREHPDKATTLYAMEILHGGNTTNCYQAAETLLDDVKSKLANRRAIQVFEYGAVTKEESSTAKMAAGGAIGVSAPSSGRTALYVSELMTEEIGLPEDESRELLEFLFNTRRKRNFSTNMSGVRAIW